jgi:beta-lactamase class A
MGLDRGATQDTGAIALRCTRRLALLAVAVAVAVAALLAGIGAPRASARTRQANPFASSPLRDYLAHRAGNVTAAVYDVNTGTTYLYRPHVREHTASIVKVDILATLLHQAQVRGAGLSPAQQALAVPMIEQSDNGAAEALWEQAGRAAAVRAFDQGAGIDDTTPNVAGYWGLTWTTARDQVDLLRDVMLPNQLLNLAARRYEYELMRHVIPGQRWGISAGVGGGAMVAIKNGWLPLTPTDWQVNSIGSVAGSGRRYLLAVLTKENPTEDYGIATIEHIAAAAWQTLGRRDPSASWSTRTRGRPTQAPAPGSRR